MKKLTNSTGKQLLRALIQPHFLHSVSTICVLLDIVSVFLTAVYMRNRAMPRMQQPERYRTIGMLSAGASVRLLNAS